MWTIGRIDLGLSDDEFWRLTPRLFDALCRRHLDVDKRADFRAGVVASVIANANAFRKPGAKPFEPADFFPGLGGAPKEQTPEEMIHMVELWNAALGGDDVRGVQH